MTGNEQALYAEMQNRGYSYGLCMTALKILSTSKQAVSEMLAYLYDEQPSEEPMEQREQSQTCFELCRVVTEEDKVKCSLLR